MGWVGGGWGARGGTSHTSRRFEGLRRGWNRRGRARRCGDGRWRGARRYVTWNCGGGAALRNMEL
eukprot:scaffold20980_cov55-Phaeocystis_antarctica.AAC.1